MRCHICDKTLTDKEVVFNKDLVNPDGSGGYEPCTVCLEVAMDAAFSQGYKRPDDHEIPEEIGDEFGDGELENFELEDDTSSEPLSLFVNGSYGSPEGAQSWGDSYDD